MPFYEYQCEDCKDVFSELRKIADREQPIACPTCGGEGKVMISRFAQGHATGGREPGGSCTPGST